MTSGGGGSNASDATLRQEGEGGRIRRLLGRGRQQGSRRSLAPAEIERVRYGLAYADWKLAADGVGILATWRIRRIVSARLSREVTADAEPRAVEELVDRALDMAFGGLEAAGVV